MKIIVEGTKSSLGAAGDVLKIHQEECCQLWPGGKGRLPGEGVFPRNANPGK